MLCVTIKCKVWGHKNPVLLHFLLGISHIYYSVSYSVSSLYVNQDREVDSCPKIVLKCSRMKEREGEYSTSYCQVMWLDFNVT